MAEIAPELGAMVVFCEHRYYGASWGNGSWPFGASSFEPDKVGFLTVEQALADFADVIRHVRSRWQARASTAVISFGGSYGANLAMWMRMKYPWVVGGAIASSLSVQKHLLRRSNIFAQIVTEAYANVSAACPRLIREGWSQLTQRAATSAGRRELASNLGLCAPPSDEAAALQLYGWLSDGIETMVQYGYPYPTSFYNPVPGFPFKVACERMVKVNTPLGALRAAAEVYYNYTGNHRCFNPGVASSGGGRGARSRRLGAGTRFDGQQGWGYQTCTEVYQPMPSNGLYPATGGDMYLPSTPNRTAIFESCERRWGVVPRPAWEEHQFGGPNIGRASNIFMTAGQLDPWRAGGITPAELPGDVDLSIVSRPFPSWNRSISTEIYLCHACSYHEIENGNGRPGVPPQPDGRSPPGPAGIQPGRPPLAQRMSCEGADVHQQVDRAVEGQPADADLHRR
jgi:lysosomal Pro-X carboxypeptidase